MIGEKRVTPWLFFPPKKLAYGVDLIYFTWMTWLIVRSLFEPKPYDPNVVLIVTILVGFLNLMLLVRVWDEYKETEHLLTYVLFRAEPGQLLGQIVGSLSSSYLRYLLARYSGHLIVIDDVVILTKDEELIRRLIKWRRHEQEG